jgi:hypothetical protein
VIVKKGQIVTLKPECMDPGESNLPHVALEDSVNGTVRVEVAGAYKYRFKPINEWQIDWIAT